MKTFYSILLALLMIPAFSSCKKENFVMNYEQPLATLVRAAAYSDTEAYLSCFIPDASEFYKQSDDYNKNLAKTLLPKNDKENTVFNFEVKNKKDLSGEDILKLEKEYKDKYKKNIKIKKAFQLNTEFIFGEDEEQTSHRLDLTVVKINDSWYIFSDVITNFNLKK